MLPESYHLFEASRDQGVSERRSASGRAEARARSSIASQVFSTYLITVNRIVTIIPLSWGAHGQHDYVPERLLLCAVPSKRKRRVT